MAVARRANWSGAEVEATEEGFVLRVPIEGEDYPEWEVAYRRASTVEGRPLGTAAARPASAPSRAHARCGR